MNAQTLLAIAVQVAQGIALGQKALAEIRAAFEREHPESLADFDKAVASARKPWQTAADAATRENAEPIDPPEA